jgi:hypothetical protein
MVYWQLILNRALQREADVVGEDPDFKLYVSGDDSVLFIDEKHVQNILASIAWYTHTDKELVAPHGLG